MATTLETEERMSDWSTEFPGPTPQLVVADAEAAIRFYQVAFASDELVRNHTSDGRIMHAELLMFGGRIFVIDDFDGQQVSSPTLLGGTTVRLHLYVPDVDEVYARAIAAGATSIAEPRCLWGDRYALIGDPFGHQWSLGTPREDLTVAELEGRADD